MYDDDDFWFLDDYTFSIGTISSLDALGEDKVHRPFLKTPSNTPSLRGETMPHYPKFTWFEKIRGIFIWLFSLIVLRGNMPVEPGDSIPRFKEIQHSDRLDPETWREGRDMMLKTAFFKDPRGHVINLRNHEIDEKGRVYPMVECEICSYHTQIQLVGWEPE